MPQPTPLPDLVRHEERTVRRSPMPKLQPVRRLEVEIPVADQGARRDPHRR